MARSATGMTDKQCKVSSKACGLRGGRELTTIPVAKQVSTGRSWMENWTGEVPAGPGSYSGVFALPSLRGARFLACAGNKLRNLRGEPNGIATPRHVGARNDKGAWCWMNEAATKGWRRDLQERVSSLLLGLTNRTTISTHGAFSTGRMPVGRGQ